MKLNKCIEKTCCFYASDWHLTVMLLPYLNKKIEEKDKVYMKFEKSIEENVTILLGKLEIKNKEDIKQLSWNEEVNEDEYCENEKIYIISGSEEYIKEKNNIIEQYYSNKVDKIKIINCYEISEKTNLYEIVEKYKYKHVLNTKGEVKLQDNLDYNLGLVR